MPAAGGLPSRDLEGGGGSVLEAPFLFGHRGGDILGADGSTLPTPVLTASISSVQYVPLQFAQEHYSKLTAEYVEAGQKYQDILKRVKEGYDRQLRDSQQVYETFVAELKEKAQRHVAVQQQLRKQEEGRLQELLRKESVETSDLRDKLASKTRELQEQQARLDELKTSHARLRGECDKRAAADSHLLLEQQPVLNQQQQEQQEQQERVAAELESHTRRLEASDADIARLNANLVQLTAQNQELQAALSDAQRKAVTAKEAAAAAAATAAIASVSSSAPSASAATATTNVVAASTPSPAVQPLALPESAAAPLQAQAERTGISAPALPAKPPKPSTAAATRSMDTQTTPRAEEEEASKDAAAPPAPTLAPTPAGAAVASADAAEPAPTAAPPAADRSAVEALEDSLHEARRALQQSGARAAELEEGKEFVARQLAELLKEKRTDVVKKLGEENELLRQRLAEMAESQAALKAATSKSETRAAEFKQRAESAEALLRSQDAAAIAQLPTDSEMGRVRKENAKQREDLIAKSKAVTAGWDAAATAEERYDVEITRAFDKGFREASQRSQQAHDLLHLSLEEKEARIAELLRQAGENELQRRESDQRVEAAEKRANEAALEVADTIALMGGGGEGGEDGAGASLAELDSARAELDAAQEEVVELQARIEDLEAAAQTSAQAIELYEQLKSLDKRPRPAASRPAAGGAARFASPGPQQRDDETSSRLTETLIAVKSALGKGAGLWKASKRDETFALYKEAIEDVLRCINSPVLVQPLRESLENSKSNDAGKFAPILRKALEKFQQDGKTPAARRGEESAAQSAGGGGRVVDADEAAVEAATDASSALVRELESELRALRQQLAHTKQQEELRKQAASGEAKDASSRDTLQGSILTRAQRAERQVETLRKQLQLLAKGGGGGAAGGAAGGSSKAQGGGADKVDVDLAVENRRLNRRVKLLEEQLLVGGGGGGGGDGAGNKRAQVMADKQAARKLKEIEAGNKKEVRALEARAAKAEKEAKEAREGLAPIKEERDALKDKVKALLPVAVELERLREELGSLGRLKDENDQLAADLARVSATLVTESGLRKKYKNELEDLKGAIRVYARCRPMARYEEERGCSAVVTFKDESSMSVASSRGDKAFEFDAVFGPNSTQEQVFEDTRRLVESCLDGYNVCLFAYGQTGSGKTHTLTGSAEHPGLTPRVIREIFRLIEEKPNQTVTVRTYFLELYLDALVDLYQVLDSKRGRGDPSGPPKLEIKMDDKKMVYVRNAVIKDVGSPQELLDLFRDGNLERHTGATKMNAESSRSHSIFSILLESYDKTTKRTISGKISLVDLAGSERADKTGASADRLKEAQAINKSLSALGDVIAALSEGEKFVPYRNNKLTQLMQDSLGGNAKTLMFVNFSPADYNSDETVSSLNYAARVKKIVNSALKAVDSAEVARLKAVIKRLQGGLPGAADEEPDAADAEAGAGAGAGEAGGGSEAV